jgi:steroid 5-alpha reductase family enzyme
MNLNKFNKLQSALVLLVVYLVAIAFGALTYHLSGMFLEDVLIQMLIADIVATLLVWGFGLLIRNSSAYDPYWSVIPPVILFAFVAILQVKITLGSAMLLGAVSLWAVRLTTNWYLNWEDFSSQDWRYTMIHDRQPRIWFLSNLFGIHLMPTAIVFIQLIGATNLLAMEPGFHPLILLGFLISLSAALIQFVADRQMMRFRLTHQGQKACIEEGLWKYSRHPNYFGEVWMWWGVWIMYFGVSGKLDLTLIAPVLMTALFLFISIPMMEKKILLSRPQYQEYRTRVSILIPFFPKRKLASGSIETETDHDHLSL